jgi:hypothetical protein
MNTPTETQKRALILIVSAITETIKEAGELGAPGGHMYAALMAHGCTLNQFESIMAALVRLGRVEKRGQSYFLKGGAQ